VPDGRRRILITSVKRRVATVRTDGSERSSRESPSAHLKVDRPDGVPQNGIHAIDREDSVTILAATDEEDLLNE